MIITTIKNNKLFIKFDSLVTEGVIYLVDNQNFKTEQNIKNSDFEVMDLPAKAEKINIQIEIGEQKITKTIILRNQLNQTINNN
jgi:hypothetical protein